MDVDLILQHPFTAILNGPTGYGKSSFCVKWLKNLHTKCTELKFRGGIIWCYSEKTAVPYKHLTNLRNVRLQEGVPEIFGDAHGKTSLLILDDLLNQVY
jgi:ABC-type phosphate transport system ATPase subunit